jgi:hypothetical protein
MLHNFCGIPEFQRAQMRVVSLQWIKYTFKIVYALKFYINLLKNLETVWKVTEVFKYTDI